MAEQTAEPDYLKRAVHFPAGTFEQMPLDWGKDQVLNAAGVPRRTLREGGEVHPLRQGLTDTHGSALVDGVKYVPAPFPSAGDNLLSTAGDYLTALDKAARVYKSAKQETPPVQETQNAPVVPAPANETPAP